MRVVLTLGLLMSLGCAGSRPQQVTDELRPMIGIATEDSIFNRLGVPHQQQAIGDSVKVWVYRFTKGTYTSNGLYYFTPCDLLTITFRSGKMIEVKSEFFTDCPR